MSINGVSRMTRDEAVQKLAKVARISLAYAEDLYDSFFHKPVIPYYIADYLEKVKSEGDLTVVGAVNEAPEGRVGDWLTLERVNVFATAWVNGYTVEDEPRYTVEIKGIDDEYSFLNYSTSLNAWSFNDDEGTKYIRVTHTRKELENANFGWVFDCPGMEVKEVK
jgi:phenylacetate-coenzyme A ligase PaaK-like adenylate-forming protein